MKIHDEIRQNNPYDLVIMSDRTASLITHGLSFIPILSLSFPSLSIILYPYIDNERKRIVRMKKKNTKC